MMIPTFSSTTSFLHNLRLIELDFCSSTSFEVKEMIILN